MKTADFGTGKTFVTPNEKESVMSNQTCYSNSATMVIHY